MTKYRTVWHPVSPGIKVEIPNYPWNRWRKYATIGQTVRYYTRLQKRLHKEWLQELDDDLLRLKRMRTELFIHDTEGG